MTHTPYDDVAKTHTPFSDVAKKHSILSDLVDPGGRHEYGHEYQKTARILYGDHVRYGGVPKVTKSTIFSDVEL